MITEEELNKKLSYWKRQERCWLGRNYARLQVKRLKLELKKLKKSNK